MIVLGVAQGNSSVGERIVRAELSSIVRRLVQDFGHVYSVSWINF